MSMRLDATEAVTGRIVGFLVATVANYLALPAIWGLTPSVADSLGMGLFFMVISMPPAYAVRRFFRWLDRSVKSENTKELNNAN